MVGDLCGYGTASVQFGSGLRIATDALMVHRRCYPLSGLWPVCESERGYSACSIHTPFEGTFAVVTDYAVDQLPYSKAGSLKTSG